MKKRGTILLFSAFLLTLMTGGISGCKKYDGEKARAERNQWVESLKDSISAVEKERLKDSLQIESLRTKLDSTMKYFSQVNNPREVEPYYILSSWRSNYPLTSTGIAARITNNLDFELIAALQGNRFDAIRLISGGDSQNSTVIPADQGLNYTAGGLTVCAFSGGQNDSLGRFVDNHVASQITLEYLKGGARRHTMTLSEDRKKWIADTWRLTHERKQLDSLEVAQTISARKLEILNITLNNENKKVTAAKEASEK